MGYYMLLKVEEPGSARIIELDDSQPFFDEAAKQIRINLTGKQTEQVKKWQINDR